MEGKQGRIEEVIADLVDDDDPRAVSAWNTFADENGWERIYSMDEFDEVMGDLSPHDIASMVCCTGFYQHDDWFWFNSNGNVESAYGLCEADIYPDELAEWAVDSDEDYGIPEVREILDEDEDEAA